MTRPSPANLIVFLDEHPDTIAACPFVTDPVETGTWWGLPASGHNDAGTFSFADGHIEAHVWQRPATRQPVTCSGQIDAISDTPGNVDISWITNHVSTTLQ
jgi:prepilin-type processing-associated H-X9-DG protein